MTKRGLATIRQEQGYALISVLLLVAMLLVITLLIYFPQIALWLPDKMFG